MQRMIDMALIPSSLLFLWLRSHIAFESFFLHLSHSPPLRFSMALLLTFLLVLSSSSCSLENNGWDETASRQQKGTFFGQKGPFFHWVDLISGREGYFSFRQWELRMGFRIDAVFSEDEGRNHHWLCSSFHSEAVLDSKICLPFPSPSSNLMLDVYMDHLITLWMYARRMMGMVLMTIKESSSSASEGKEVWFSRVCHLFLPENYSHFALLFPTRLGTTCFLPEEESLVRQPSFHPFWKEKKRRRGEERTLRRFLRGTRSLLKPSIHQEEKRRTCIRIGIVKSDRTVYLSSLY